MSGPSDGQSVLVVDDDEAFRTRLGRSLQERGYAVRLASHAAEALTLAAEESPELAVVDLRMPGMSGLELVRALAASDPATRIVVLTGYGSIATAVEAVKLGAAQYLSKPTSIDELLRAFEPDAQAAPAPPEQVASLARMEWEHINRVLQECGRNISQAARLLGLHRRSLQRKLAKYPVSR